jgi:hypothetical protein
MVMSKKKLLAVTFIMVLFVSIVVSTLFVSLVSANMFPPFVPRIPTSNPVISCISPNNETYTTNRIPLIVNVSNANPSDITQCKLDGNIKGQFYGSDTFELNLVGLSDGPHQIEIHIYYYGLSVAGVPLGAPYPNTPDIFEKRLFISFTVASSLPSPSPTLEPSRSAKLSSSPTPSPNLAPTLEPKSTPEPTSTPNQQTGFLGTNFPANFAYAATIVVVALVSIVGVMAYSKRARRTMPPIR